MKKIYQKPEFRTVILKQRMSLLFGSDQTVNMNSNKASYTTSDGNKQDWE